MMLAGRGQRGAAMILVVVVCILIMAFGGAFMALTAAMSRQTGRDLLGLHALYCAETGAAIAVSQLNAGTLPTDGPEADDGVLEPTGDKSLESILSGIVGGANDRSYTITIALWGRDGVDNDDNGTVDDSGEAKAATVTARGVAGGEVRQVECIVGRGSLNPLQFAYFEGGANGGYTLQGSGARADYLQGDVYKGGNMSVTQGANIDGRVIANGNVTDNSSAWKGAWEQGTQPGFDFKKHNYAAKHDVNVASALKSDPERKFGAGLPAGGGNAVGGKAWQVPDTNPAHIFRLNPDDRTSAYKDYGYQSIYALEDPYEQRRDDPNWNGTDATKISHTPGYEYGKVYYLGPSSPSEKVAMIIDNSTSYSYKFNTPGAEATGQQTVIVVKGDIHIGDNIFHTNKNKDAVVFIALKNDDGTGGNIYFGDSRFGTVENFNAFMYAENNFISSNVSADESKILVHGNMAAGNEMKLNLGTGSNHHKLEVIHDTRISDTLNGTASPSRRLDGIVGILPEQNASALGDYAILSWRQISPLAAPATQGPVFAAPASAGQGGSK